MTPHERELGELIGELRGELHGIGKQLTDFQNASATEHAASARRFEQMRAEVNEGLAQKADRDDVGELREDVDELMLNGARTSGRDSTISSFAKGAFGAIVTILISLLFGHPAHTP